MALTEKEPYKHTSMGISTCFHKYNKLEFKFYKPWVPKDKDLVYTITNTGMIYETEYDSHTWLGAYNQGILFQTKEEAEQEIECRKARHTLEQEIARLNEGWTPDGIEKSNCVAYEYIDKALLISGHTQIKYHKDWFYLKSDKLAEQLIKTHSKELKLYLGV